MQFTVLLFAQARELVDASSVTLDVDTTASDASSKADTVPISALITALLAHSPQLAPVMQQSILSINYQYVDFRAADSTDEQLRYNDAVRVSSKDEIALIPPISGG